MNSQNYYREEIKRLRWEEDITFKEIAINLLDMNYHSFINWLGGRCNLSRNKLLILQDYIDCFH